MGSEDKTAFESGTVMGTGGFAAQRETSEKNSHGLPGERRHTYRNRFSFKTEQPKLKTEELHCMSVNSDLCPVAALAVCLGAVLRESKS